MAFKSDQPLDAIVASEPWNGARAMLEDA